MPTAKANITDLFKNGSRFKFKVIDYGSKKVASDIKEVRRQRQAIRNSAKFNVNELKKIIFDL